MKRIKTDEASCKRRHGGIMFLKIQSVTFMLLLIILFSGVVSGGDYNSAAAVLLDRIALGEGTTDAAAQKHGLASAYDITYAYGIYNPKDSKPLTEMTIGEVKQLQQQMLANQAGSSAVGKYQILYKTLFGDARTGAPGLQKTLGLSDNIPFDAATQEKLGLALLEGRNFKDWINGKISDYQFQQNMAKEWASVADPDTGKSRYGTDGMCCGCTPGIKCQSVGTTSEQIREAMTKAKSLLGISQPRITLTLYVHDGSASGPVIPSAKVTGQDVSGHNFEQTTDSSGYVTITGDPGTWSFSASADGYKTNSWDQEITETCTKNAFLQESETTSLRGDIYIGDRVRTTSDKKLNVRTYPGINSPSINSMVKGSIGTVIDGPISADNLNWWKIEYDAGITGWSSGKWLELTTAETQDTEQTTVTTFKNGDRVRTTSDKKLNVRSGPGISSQSISTVVKGSIGTIIDGPVFKDNLYWWKIMYYASVTGWSSGKWLEFAPQTQIGCNKDPVTGQVKCSDDISVFSNEPIAQPLSDGATNNEPVQPQTGCHEDPVTGQTICEDDFSGDSQQQPLVGPAPRPYPAYGY